VDALAPEDDEGRGKLRKASVSRKQALTRGCPNGETQRDELTLRPAESIGWYESTQGSEPSQYLVENKSNRDSESSGERNRKSPNRRVYTAGL
jgi:hypothetical protein